jgi:hypothetical protein
MEELWAYRRRLLERHTAPVGELRRCLNGWPEDRLRTAPGRGEWSVHQVAAHLRDVEVQAYVPRVHRMLAETEPLLQDFDAEAFMAGHYDSDEPIDQIVADLERHGHVATAGFDDGRPGRDQ